MTHDQAEGDTSEQLVPPSLFLSLVKMQVCKVVFVTYHFHWVGTMFFGK